MAMNNNDNAKIYSLPTLDQIVCKFFICMIFFKELYEIGVIILILEIKKLKFWEIK